MEKTIEELAGKLPHMTKEEVREALQECTRQEIQAVAVAAGLTVPRSATKSRAIELVAGHFAYIRLHNNIVSGSRRK